jgi:indolepyruvate ferredoxin oxidoreductase
VDQLVDQIRAEGVASVILATDDPDRYGSGHPVRAKVERVEHRDDLDALQRELRERSGVSVIVYEQMCATEKRRLRKRGKLEDPSTRVFINELVCEGCGDCSAKSNCLSVEPVETPFGTKRRINQSSCNKDYSCTNGFCPSFVTIEGGVPSRAAPTLARDLVSAELPIPPRRGSDHERIVVAGVGGTGIVTIGALVAVSAHSIGAEVAVLDQVGMAQKGGAVVSHVHVANEPVTALRIPAEAASLVIVCDEVVGNNRDVIASIAPGKTPVLANSDVSVTGDFTQNRKVVPDASLLAARLKKRSGEDMLFSYPFTRLSTALLGDAIGANLMMVGFAWQKGWLDLDFAAFDAAIALNGAAVEMNRNAFTIGRRLAVEPDMVMNAAGLLQEPEQDENALERMAAFLADYQDQNYADRFSEQVAKVAAAEAKLGGDGSFKDTVAKGLFRLMAYKDEYEVARLYTDGSFAKSLGQAFDGKVRLKFHMAPPLLSRRDKSTGHLKKRTFGPWMIPVLRLLARGKALRGTRFDPLGYTAERKNERRLIADYEALVDRLLKRLDSRNFSQAKEIAAMVLEVRGYGHVKEQAMAAYEPAVTQALAAFEEEHSPALQKAG